MPASKEDKARVSREASNLLKSFIAVSLSGEAHSWTQYLHFKHNPAADYAFDSERDSQVSEICRKGGVPRQDCIMVGSSLQYSRSVHITTNVLLEAANEFQTSVQGDAGLSFASLLLYLV